MTATITRTITGTITGTDPSAGTGMRGNWAEPATRAIVSSAR